MTFFDSLILGIVEGVTEFLPISSTGHLMLAAKLLNIPQTEFAKSFEIIIQLGAIMAVVVLYWRMLLVNTEVIKKVAVAFVPTGILGLLLQKVIKQVFLARTDIVLWALFLGGILLIVFEKCYREKKGAVRNFDVITYRTAVCIGLFQSLAVVPGVSRAAATIVGGLILGLNRKTIVEFSFLLAVPTMLAATALDLLKGSAVFSAQDIGYLGAGFVTSFLVAMASIKFLLRFIQNSNFIPFGIYRIGAAILFWFFIR